MKTKAKNQTLDEIVQPIIDALNRHYRAPGQDEFEVAQFDLFEVLRADHDGILIELPDDIGSHPVTAAAIATLLRLTGSESTWVCGESPSGENLDGPLRFSVTKRSAWAGYFWAGGRYLVIDHAELELDADAAKRQIAALATALENPANLVELKPEEAALLF